ncbi:ATP-binding protein [Pseudonocardia xinjiangensis]|uniref:Helix-turn-helix domain-containing protein n=1 Tax=Pseudonocardia xinjiangensis TaxID=75289 RepID=A0ABX1RAC4_9PSEU|nr:LuxR family transcriptional regulator [Pseudonocardia xinjiangensis]NMH76085.1 helix-turn-helix domain-containing protein [Pseudonocardia xinjiangensis]
MSRDRFSHPRGVAGGLAGRGQELRLIRSFLASAAVEGAALLIVGEPGVGKTMLLDVAEDEASSAGSLVLRSAGVEFEADLGFSGLNQTVLPLLGETDRLSAPHREALSVALGLGSGPAPDRMVVSAATLALLCRVAADRPVLIVIDDVHWLDRTSAAVLGFVARRLAGHRIGFLAASRPGTDSFFERSGLPELELQPLDDDAALGLVSERFPALDRGVRGRLLAESQGNPLALLELPAALSHPQRSALRALPEVLPLSRRLQSLYASRISELPEPTRQLLLLATLDGTGDLRVVQAAATSARGAPGDLAPAERVGLVQVGGSGAALTFRHPLTRSAVMELSTTDERRRAHLALAQVLADQPERRAWHLGEATVEPDEEVAGLLEEAAHRLFGRGDPGGAVARLTRAADLSPLRTERSRRLAEAAYLSALTVGGVDGASELLTNALPEHSASLYAVATAAGYLLMDRGSDIDTAHGLLEAAIACHPERTDATDEELIEAIWSLSFLSWLSGSPEKWQPVHDAVARLRPRAPTVLALYEKTVPDPVRTALPVLDEIVAVCGDLGGEVDPVKIVRTGLSALYVDGLAVCRESAWRVLGDGRDGGAVTQAILAIVQLCHDDFGAGRWREMAELADEALELCDAHRFRYFRWQLQYFTALAAAVRGHQDASRAASDEIVGWATPRGAAGALAFAHHARALAAVARNDFEEAYQQAAAISAPGTFASHAPNALWVMLDLVEAATRTDRRPEATAHVTAMREARIGALSPRLALVTAGSAAIAADDDRAAGLFEQALALPEAERWPFELARVRLAYGEHLRRSRAAAASRVQLSAAREAFERLGARPWAARAAHELRATGHNRTPTPDLGMLTPQEREIAVLAASGLTNKEIGQRLYLSHRTVGAHLYRVFPKLGITSRAALRDALASVGSSSGPDAR